MQHGLKINKTSSLRLRDKIARFNRTDGYISVEIESLALTIIRINYMDGGTAWRVPSNSHNFFEFHYICEGTAYTELQRELRAIQPGWFYIIPPGTVHSHTQLPETHHTGFAWVWSLQWVNNKGVTTSISSSNVIRRLMENLQKASPLPVLDTFGLGADFVAFLGGGHEHNEEGWMNVAISFFILILKLGNIYSSIDNKKKKQTVYEDGYSYVHKNERDIRYIITDNVLSFMHEHYNQRLDAKTISGALHISYTYLARIFKQNIGHTLMEQLQLIRLEKSVEQLLTTNISIEQLAESVGFASPYYFIRRFKSQYGVPPGVYRKMHNSAFSN